MSEFIAPIDNAFNTLHDPYCRVTAEDANIAPHQEALRLYPEDSPSPNSLSMNRAPHHITLVRNKADIAQDGAAMLLGPEYKIIVSPDQYDKSQDTAFYVRKQDGELRQIVPQASDSPAYDQSVSPEETERLLRAVRGLKETPRTLYSLTTYNKNDWSWGAEYRLPKLMLRADVLQIIDNFSHLHGDPAMGLSGVLLGPSGAETVQKIRFELDPSRRYGSPDISKSAQLVAGLANAYDWVETMLEDNPLHTPNSVHTIMGRNKDRYAGKEVFSISQIEAMFSSELSIVPAVQYTVERGGYLFSSRPDDRGSSVRKYGELAASIHVSYKHANEEYNRVIETAIIRILGQVAWNTDQDRFVATSDRGTVVANTNR